MDMGHPDDPFSTMSATYVKNVPSKGGAGLFARRAIKAGRRIFSEPVLFFTQDPTPIDLCLLIRSLDASLRKKFSGVGALWFTPVQPDVLAAYRTQLSRKYNSKGDLIVQDVHLDGVARHVALFWNNCFTFRPLKNGVVGELQQAMFSKAARLNHSCVPNCYVSWNGILEQLCVHSIRDIEEDEELLITYMHDDLIVQKREDRMRKLQESYQFVCKCPACDLSKPGQAELESRKARIASVMETIRANKAAGKENVSHCTELFKLMGEIGLDTWRPIGELRMGLARNYSQRGLYDLAKEELLTALQISSTCLGEGAETTYLQEMLAKVQQAIDCRKPSVDKLLSRLDEI